MYKLRYMVFAGVLFYFQKTIYGLWRFVLFFLLVTSISNTEFKLMTPRLRVSYSIHWVNQVTLVFEILMLGIFFFSLVVSSLLVWLLPTPTISVSSTYAPKRKVVKGRECWDSEPIEQLKGTETKAITGYVSSCPSTTLKWERW